MNLRRTEQSHLNRFEGCLESKSWRKSARLERDISSVLLTRSVQISQQALFARQELHTGQEPLQALEIRAAFRCD